MKNRHARAHIRLNSQTDVIQFISALSKYEDAYAIENTSGTHRINAKSLLGVMYTMMDFPDELYLVNETNNGHIPAFVDGYRPS